MGLHERLDENEADTRSKGIILPPGIKLVKEKKLSPKQLQQGLNSLIGVLPKEGQRIVREALAKNQS